MFKKFFCILFFMILFIVFFLKIGIDTNINEFKHLSVVEANVEEIKEEIEPFKVSNIIMEELEKNIEPLKETQNILLFGVDDNQGEGYGRSDSMILLTVDPINKEIKFTSFLRDSFVNIENYGKFKLNASFALGGPEFAMKTINQNFDLNISNYAYVDFSDFVDVVDLLGGIEIYLTKKEAIQVFGKSDFEKFKKNPEEEVIEIPEEELTDKVYLLNGEQALTFCRIRKIDDDFTRSDRQKIFMKAIYEKINQKNILEKISIAKDLSTIIKSNLSEEELLKLGEQLLNLKEMSIFKQNVPFENTYRFSSYKKHFIIVFDEVVNKKKLYNFLNTPQKNIKSEEVL